jgi:anti-sigma factor RsiW
MSASLRSVRFARDHRWTPGRLSAYLDGELAPRAAARIDRHVAGCPACRAALRSLERLLRTLHEMTATGHPSRSERAPDIATAVRHRLHEPPSG